MLQARYDQGEQGEPIRLGAAPQDKESLLFNRVEVLGEFDQTGQILIDNRVVNGVAGYMWWRPCTSMAPHSTYWSIEDGWRGEQIGIICP